LIVCGPRMPIGADRSVGARTTLSGKAGVPFSEGWLCEPPAKEGDARTTKRARAVTARKGEVMSIIRVPNEGFRYAISTPTKDDVFALAQTATISACLLRQTTSRPVAASIP